MFFTMAQHTKKNIVIGISGEAVKNKYLCNIPAFFAATSIKRYEGNYYMCDLQSRVRCQTVQHDKTMAKWMGVI